MRDIFTVSIIVPVYNVESYLPKCIDSILSQSFSNFELLLIDDGSTDQSGSICDRYAIQDNRIKVFHQRNSGVSSARNVGLDHSKGEWITFVDSDDWITPDYLIKLISHVQNVDLVISGYEITNEDKKIVDVTNFHQLFSENVICYTVPWGKLYRTDIIVSRHIRFLEKMHLGEDTEFLYTYLIYVDKIYRLPDIGYHYNTDTTNSLSKRIFPYENELFTYQRITQTTDRLIIEKQIKDKVAIERLTKLKIFLMARVLNALYHNKVSRNIRLQVIRQIDVASSITQPVSLSWKESFLNWLLWKRIYVCYDMLRFSVTFLKRSLKI